MILDRFLPKRRLLVGRCAICLILSSLRMGYRPSERAMEANVERYVRQIVAVEMKVVVCFVLGV